MAFYEEALSHFLNYETSLGQAPTAIDVVVAFEDMKNKIDEVKRALQGNSIHKKIMSPADEDYIHLISKMARKRLADYQGHLQSKKNRYNTTASAGLIASRNVLRNFFNNNAQKLNPILMKCGVTEVSFFVFLFFFLNVLLVAFSCVCSDCCLLH